MLAGKRVFISIDPFKSLRVIMILYRGYKVAVLIFLTWVLKTNKSLYYLAITEVYS